MSNAPTVVVVYPVYNAEQKHEGLAATARNLAASPQATKLIVAGADAAVQAKIETMLDGVAVSFEPDWGTTFAQLINAATAKAPDAIVVPLSHSVELLASFPEAVAKTIAAKPENVATFGSYKRLGTDGGADEDIKVYPIEKPQHERNDLGYVQAYDAAAVKAVGGADESLAYVADYDLMLKLVEEGEFANIAEPQYRVLMTAEDLAANKDHFATGGKFGPDEGKSIYAPGRKKWGGLPYLFYPELLDKELNDAYEAHLKRLDAYLTEPTIEVPYPADETYAVKASVVIPVLNRVTYIGKAIASVVAGKFEDFEVIVVDNGSTDGSPDAVREWSQKDKRIRLIEQRGPSIASALNRGIREARGKYICQLDSDDVYTEDTLEMMVGHFESHPKCGLAISYYGLMDPDGKPLPELGLIKHLGYERNIILRRDGAGALRVFARCVLEENGLYDEEHFGNFGEDYDMVLKTGEKYDVDRVHAELYRYRRHPDNTDVTRDPGMKIRNKNQARLNAIARRQAANKA